MDGKGDAKVAKNGVAKASDLTSKDYYFDSYAHFGIHEVHLFSCMFVFDKSSL